MLAENIVKLNNNEVYEQIQKYLKKREYNSINTKVSYEKHIKRFFEVVKKKEIQFLSKEDIQITLDDFEDFIEYLHDRTKLSNTTINKNVTAVKELLRYLYSKKLVEDIGYINARQIDRLPQTKNSYGVLSVSEVETLAELSLKEREKGEIKRLLILFSLDTCIRKKAALNLRWSDFEKKEDGILVKAVDKGNTDYRPKIAHWFYEELLTLKKDDCERVFDISKDSVEGMMDRLLKKAKIAKEERNIVFHSIRKAGVTFQYRLTGDILQAKKAANHSNIQTTMDYLADEDFGVIGAVSTKGKIDTGIINEISHEELLEAISKCNKDLQLILSLKIKELYRE